MQFELVELSKLNPAKYNPRKIDDRQLSGLKESIKKFGFIDPIIVNKKNNVIVGGHQRAKVAESLGINEVPVSWVDLSLSEEKALNVALNSHTISGEYDKDILPDLLKEIKDDLPDLFDDLNFDDFDVELPEVEILDPQTDEDEVPEVENPITRRGDIWLLGKHRLMCGDSTMIDDVEKLMAGEKADMVFTDPPYGMFLDTDYSDMKGWAQGKKYKPVAGDNEDFSDDLINTIFTFSYVKEMFIWGADYFAELIPDKNMGSWLVWDKRVDESKDAMYGSCFELCWSKNKHKREFLRYMWAGFMGDKEARNRVHPTQKPTEMIVGMFDKWCKDLTKCVDLYGGSGSTMLACEKTNKHNYTMELDEYYCDVIINRWQNYTGKKATLESTGQTYEELKKERENV